MPLPYLANSVVRAVERSVCDRNARIVDVSCGAGEILEALRDRGYTKLSGTRFTECEGAPKDVRIIPNVDLLKGLPFDDGSYDVVICTEVLEHLCNHVKAIEELTRVVRPGGVLFLSTPNILRLRSRFVFFLSGFHKSKSRFVRYDVPLSRYYESHNFVIGFPVLHYFLTACGMTVEKLYRSKIRLVDVVLLLILFLPVSVSMACQLFVCDRDPRQRKPYRELFRLMLHPYMLGSGHLILRARKRRG